MIIETLGDLFFSVVLALLGTFEVVGLPLDAISVLASFTKYASFVVGSDLLVLLVGSFVFFIGVRLGVGLALKIWDMLPFT